MSEADPTRREDPPAGDPNAPLPDDAPAIVKAFYDWVTEALDGVPEGEVLTPREALALILEGLHKCLSHHPAPR